MTTYTTQKISQRTAAGTLTGAEIFPVVRTGDSGDYRTTVDAVFTYVITNTDFTDLLEDNFGTHIVEGFDAVFENVDIRNAAETSTWRDYVDASGNRYIVPQSGLEGILALNAQGDTITGELNYRTNVRALSSTTYTVLGSSDSAAVLKMTHASGCAITFLQDSAVVDPALDLLYTNNFGMVQRAGGPVSFIAGTGVTFVNAKTGGSTITIPSKGGVAIWRRVGTNTYEFSGDINGRRLHSCNALTSTAGALAIDLALGDVGTYTPTENVTAITFTNAPTVDAQHYTFRHTQHASAAKTLTGWPAAVIWFNDDGEFVPSSDVGAVDEVVLTFYPDGVITGKYGLAAT